jgi:hypothetical protein
MPLLKMVKLES